MKVIRLIVVVILDIGRSDSRKDCILQFRNKTLDKHENVQAVYKTPRIEINRSTAHVLCRGINPSLR